MEARGTALVTGASRGIGRGVAVELADRGFEVIASMRDPAAGADLAREADGPRGGIRVACLDVNAPEAFDFPDDLSVLVNNAGVEGAYLPVETAPLSLWRHLFETNVFGLVATSRLAIPLLRRNAPAVLCNVGSSSILAPMPFYAAYRASKAAVSAIGESLRAELAPFGVRVVEIMPGPIETDMLEGSARMPEAAEVEGYRPMAERAYAGRMSAGETSTSVADASRAIADAIQDDGGPLRYGCDPMSVAMLGGWRQSSDEDFMHATLAGMGLLPEEL